MSETGKFRMAILGVGRIALRAMAPGIRESKSAALYALGTSSPQKAEQLASEESASKCYGSYQALLDDPQVEGVYIGLPNHLHREWTLRSLKAGKHVLCDKPLGMNAQEAVEMNAAAGAAGRLLMEAFMYRFHPQHDEVRRLVSGGHIGRIRWFEAHFHYFLEDRNNIRMKPQMGGGGLWDVGCYGIDSARYVFGAEPLACAGVWHVNDCGVDDFCQFTLRFPGDLVASVTCGMHQPGIDAYIVRGDLVSIEVPQAYISPRDAPAQVVVRTTTGRSTHRTAIVNQYAAEIDGFVAAARGAADPRVGNGIENMVVLDAVRRACETGKVEPIMLPPGSRT